MAVFRCAQHDNVLTVFLQYYSDFWLLTPGDCMTTLVLKIGGNEIDDPTFVAELARVVAGMRPVPVLVHGGGKEIGAIQRARGGEPRFVGGLRVTDAYALQ